MLKWGSLSSLAWNESSVNNCFFFWIILNFFDVKYSIIIYRFQKNLAFVPFLHEKTEKLVFFLYNFFDVKNSILIYRRQKSHGFRFLSAFFWHAKKRINAHIGWANLGWLGWRLLVVTCATHTSTHYRIWSQDVFM